MEMAVKTRRDYLGSLCRRMNRESGSILFFSGRTITVAQKEGLEGAIKGAAGQVGQLGKV